MKKIFIMSFALLVICNCAKTNILTYQEPKTEKRYSHILISMTGANYIAQKDLEDRFVSVVSKCCNVKLTTTTSLFPPTKTFSEADTEKIIKQSGADGILVFQTKSTNSAQKNSIMPMRVGTMTAFMPYSYSTVYQAKDIYLIDIEHNTPVWFASTSSSGDSLNNINGSEIRSVIKELFKSNLLSDEKCYEKYAASIKSRSK